MIQFTAMGEEPGLIWRKFTSQWSNYADRIFPLVTVNDIVEMSYFDNKGSCFYLIAINICNIWTFILSVIIDPCGPVVTEKCDVSQGITK